MSVLDTVRDLWTGLPSVLRRRRDADPGSESLEPGPRILLQVLDAGLEPPAYAHPGDAGADLRSTGTFVLQPGERRLVPTGVALAIPEGYAGFVHPRSGLAARHGISLVNTPGTIDAGYRGEVSVCLVNTDRDRPFTVRRGDRIAQLVVQPVVRASFVPVVELPGSLRGAGGYGSTGGFGTAGQDEHHFQA